MLGIYGHHAALAWAQVQDVIRELDSEIPAPDNDGLCRAAMAAPLPRTTTDDPHKANGDTTALGGFLAAATGLEACKGGCEVDHGHGVSPFRIR